MGIYDRDYYRQPPPRGGFANFSMWSVTTWLIVINVAVYLIDALWFNQLLYRQFPDAPEWFYRMKRRTGTGPLEEWGYFSVDLAIRHLQIWRFVTYQFLHANLQHLFFNMLGLYFFGPVIESYLGAKRYLAFYLLCGCSGAVVYTLLYFLGPLHQPGGDAVPLIGASAGIYGVLVAAAVLAPNVTIVLMFPPIPIQLKYLAMILVGVATFTALTSGRNAGGEAAHLGGAALGYWLIRHPHVLAPFARMRRSGVRNRTRFRDWSNDPDH